METENEVHEKKDIPVISIYETNNLEFHQQSINSRKRKSHQVYSLSQ